MIKNLIAAAVLSATTSLSAEDTTRKLGHKELTAVPYQSGDDPDNVRTVKYPIC